MVGLPGNTATSNVSAKREHSLDERSRKPDQLHLYAKRRRESLFPSRSLTKRREPYSANNFLAASRTLLTSSLGATTLACPPQLNTQRCTSARLESFMRNSAPPSFKSRNC